MSPAVASLERTERVRSKGLSLRAQVALVIAGLSFIPTVITVFILVRPAYPQLAAAGRDLWLSLLVWLILLALVSAGIGYILSFYLLLPLTKLESEVSELQRQTERLNRVQPLTPLEGEPQEVDALRRSFNGLLRQVDLEQSRRAAFMATLMHDLKTPLIAASHLLRVVQERDAMPREERVSLVSELLRENDRLVSLVQKMVEAHRFEREEVVLDRSPTPVESCVQVVLERTRPLAKERDIDMFMQGGAEADIDKAELERALYNLLSNAVRYARSRIMVEIYKGLIRISDDGPGLPASLETLAQPFNGRRVDIAGQRYNAGTAGLGLFIARRIIEAHGGRLVVERTGEQGTTLLVYLG